MINSQCLTIMVVSSRGSSEQDIRFGGIGVAIPCWVISSAQVRYWDFLGDPTSGVLDVTWFGLNINKLASHIATDICRALFVDLVICVDGLSLYSRPYMSYMSGQQGMVVFSQPIIVKLRISLHPNPNLRDPPQSRSATHSCSSGIRKNPCGVVLLALLLQEAHQYTKYPALIDPKPPPSVCTLEVGSGQRHTTDAVPDYCSFQARLRMHCVAAHSDIDGK